MKLLFLDIDGVLNSSSFYNNINELEKYKYLSFPLDSFDYRAVELLNYIIDNTDAKLVISSDWRFDDDLIPCLKYHGLKHDVYGITPYDKHNRRGYEIQKYLLSIKNEDIKSYCIIDDIVDWFLPNQQNYVIKTTTEYGLTKELANKAIKILNDYG